MRNNKKKLIDICNIQYGYAFDSKQFTEAPTDIPLIRIRDVNRGYSDTYYAGDYNEAYIVNAGDVLIGMDGEFNIAKWKSLKALLNQRVCKLICNESVVEDYLVYYLSGVLKEIEAKTSFATVKHLSAKVLNSIELTLHEIDEQTKIANILNNVKQIIDKRQKQLVELDDLVKSQFIEMFGDPIKNEKNWETRKLDDVCPVNKYKGQVDSTNGQVWLLNLDKIESDTGKILNYVLEDESKIASSTIKFDTNCVLYSKLRPYLNKVVIPPRSGYATSEMIAIQTNIVDKYFLSSLLRMKSFVDFANGTSYGAKMPRASVDMIKNFDLIFPPKELQNSFAQFAQQVDKLKFCIQQSLDETQKLFDSLMQKYFG